MKKTIKTTTGRIITGAMMLLAGSILPGCNKDNTVTNSVPAQSFTEVNLVASDATISATRIDAGLINAWGLAMSPTGNAWISAAGSGTSAVYSSMGVQALPAVTIPTHGALTGGIPTGQVFNGTTGFVLSNASSAKFIFAGIDGIISGWSSGTGALVAVDRHGLAVYTGLAMAVNGTNSFLYAANFTGNKVEVFDNNFALQTSTFVDPALPAGYAPFNIQNIGGLLYVMYAEPDPVTDEIKGPGLGLVDVFNPDGSFVKRLISTGSALNAPWGIAQAPAGWLTGATGTVLLVGNFGDGHINAFDGNGNLLGTLQSGGSPITISGLWALSFAPASATAVDPNWLYFTAGPADETKGLFGYITK
jgi:uncharacterized protein (TIGR03118 family)